MAQLKETSIQNQLSIINNSDNLKFSVNNSQGEISLGNAKITLKDKSYCDEAKNAKSADTALSADSAKKLSKACTLKIGEYYITTDFSSTSDIVFKESTSNPENKFVKQSEINLLNSRLDSNNSRLNQIENAMYTQLDQFNALTRGIKEQVKYLEKKMRADDGIPVVTSPMSSYFKKQLEWGPVYSLDIVKQDKKKTVILCTHAPLVQKKGSSMSATAICTATSDIRLKENIKDSKVSGLDLINQIQLKEFDWKDSDAHWNIGMIADEIEKLDPMLVTGGGYDKNNNMITKSVELFYLQGYEIKAIQELSKENQELKKQLAVLTEKIDRLEAHM